ncbi:MAG TPA: HAD-IIIA family hydrolase [Candidatus Aquilonibacter sp.]|nr:HAD-IIIA family hydrolase [Candidatus Aquilonibacter sp.]
MITWYAADAPKETRALFLDRDGVINVHIPGGYVLDYRKDFVLRDQCVASLRPFSDAGIPIVVVSNQSCVGRGMISAQAEADIMDAMVADLRAAGVHVSAYAFCPHAPQENCACRKPSPVMILETASALAIPVEQSLLIGDQSWDLEAAERAGCDALRVGADDAEYKDIFGAAYAKLQTSPVRA